MKILDLYFKPYIDSKALNKIIKSLAKKINKDYLNKEFVIIGVLNGSFVFLADISKLINLPCEISFIKFKSYINASTSGKVNELIGLECSIKNKHVLIVEDIVDTGLTMDKIIETLSPEKPKSIEICTLLFKKEAFKGQKPPKYIGAEIENKFVVGYGLDYNEYGRNLPFLYIKED